MKKITQKAREAFLEGKRFKLKNTEVRIVDNDVYLYLFGNLIAKKKYPDKEIWISDGNYGYSRTTIERLKAFVNITSVKSQFVIDNRFLWDGKWIKVSNIRENFLS